MSIVKCRRVRAGVVAGLAGLVLCGCQPGGPTGGAVYISIQPGSLFDRAAVQQAIQPFTPTDLSAFGFQIFFALQNASGADLAFTPRINGVDQARVTLPANQQTVVAVTDSCPQTIAFRDFVNTDANVTQNINLVRGEETNLAAADGGTPTFACPAIIVLVFRSDGVDAIELDRTLTGAGGSAKITTRLPNAP